MTEQRRTIVVATDFSTTAELAVDHAAALARRTGARLLIVNGHTMATYWIGPSKPMTVPASFEKEMLQNARTQLDARCARIRGEGVTVESRLVSAPGAEAVLYVAKESDAALIVTGTRGLTGFKHLLLGSTAQAIAHHTERPVLAIHPGDPVPPDGPLRVVLPTDFSEDAQAAQTRAIELIARGQAGPGTLILAHVVHAPAFVSPFAGDVPMRQVFLEEARAAALEELDRLAASLREEGHSVETVVAEGDPAETLAAIARDRRAALIAMGTRGLSGLKRIVQGSVADKTLRHAPCPVLTVPRVKAS